MALMLNLGCGERCHPEWINIDHSRLNRIKGSAVGGALSGLNLLSPLPDGYVNHDLRKGIPFADASADAVYSSHVLEHIDRRHIPQLLTEVLRVLGPNGVFRVVVPDLEKIVKDYLAALTACQENPVDPVSAENYDRAMLWLFDQMVRSELGGEMKHEMPNGKPSNGRASGLQRIKLRAARVLTPDDPAATHELHRWMYDGYSLTRALSEAGFTEITRVTAHASRIPNWSQFALDIYPDNEEREKESLYVESVRPS